MKMEDYQQRVIDEKNGLDEKRNKLKDFLYTDIYANLPDGERGNLQAQYMVMGNYSDILQTRIEGFS